MKSSIITSFKILFVMTLLTGFLYPMFITGIVQVLFPGKANGSMIHSNGEIIGSGLIGQQFDSSIYFWSRPSATSYNPLPSGGSNYGPTNEKLRLQKEERLRAFINAHQLDKDTEVPGEMLYASASGLDPHISPEAAFLQIDRISIARRFTEAQKQKLEGIVDQLSEKPQFGVLGNARINVLLLNLELDKIR